MLFLRCRIYKKTDLPPITINFSARNPMLWLFDKRKCTITLTCMLYEDLPSPRKNMMVVAEDSSEVCQPLPQLLTVTAGAQLSSHLLSQLCDGCL